MCGGCAYARYFVLKNETQRVNAMHADVKNWTAAGETSVVQPLSWMRGVGEKREFGASENGTTNRTARQQLANFANALLEAKDVGYAQQYLLLASGLDHPTAFVRVHGHRLFAENRLAGSNGSQHVLKM